MFVYFADQNKKFAYYVNAIKYFSRTPPVRSPPELRHLNGQTQIEISTIHRSARKTGNLVPRACDPREGNEGSGIIRFREDSDWPLKWMRSSILATIPGFRQRIIPEPSFPSQGSQARGTRLVKIRSAAFSSKK